MRELRPLFSADSVFNIPQIRGEVASEATEIVASKHAPAYLSVSSEERRLIRGEDTMRIYKLPTPWDSPVYFRKATKKRS